MCGQCPWDSGMSAASHKSAHDRTAETALLVKCLLWEHQSPEVSPRHPWNSQTWSFVPVIQGLGRQTEGDPWGLLASQPGLIQELQVCLRNKAESQRGRFRHLTLVSTST